MVSIQKQLVHVYAIIRCDNFLSDADMMQRITVKKIVWTSERAEAEASRLNALNEEKGIRYFVQLTRLEPKELAP